MNRRQLELDHLTTGQVAAMLDGRLSGEERKAAVVHLSICADCRHEVSEVEHALRANEPRHRATWRWGLGISAVAAALMIAVVPLAVRSVGQKVDPTRVGATRAGNMPSAEASSDLQMIAPADNSQLSATRMLTWRSSGSGSSYLVTVQDTSGTVIWSFPLTDTTTAVPPGAPLVAGRRYFWKVDARLANGVSATTVVRVFTVR